MESKEVTNLKRPVETAEEDDVRKGKKKRGKVRVSQSRAFWNISPKVWRVVFTLRIGMTGEKDDVNWCCGGESVSWANFDMPHCFWQDRCSALFVARKIDKHPFIWLGLIIYSNFSGGRRIATEVLVRLNVYLIDGKCQYCIDSRDYPYIGIG